MQEPTLHQYQEDLGDTYLQLELIYCGDGNTAPRGWEPLSVVYRLACPPFRNAPVMFVRAAWTNY